MVTTIKQPSRWRKVPARLANALRLPRFTEAELEQVTPTAWWVCDARVAPGSPGRLLGCIDRHGRSYELMQLGDRFSWHTFASLRDALEHVSLTAPAVPAQLRLGEPARPFRTQD